jgi:hypothetical protein
MPLTRPCAIHDFGTSSEARVPGPIEVLTAGTVETYRCVQNLTSGSDSPFRSIRESTVTGHQKREKVSTPDRAA